MGRALRLATLGVPVGGGGAAFGDGAAIYGVSWDGSSTPTLTRTDDSVGWTCQAGVDAGVVTNDADSAEIFGEITEVTDALGNVFVRIPKCYIRETATGAARTWQITKGAQGDGYLPACFWDFTHEVELDYVDVGKYPAGLDGSNRLTSKAGEYPLINKNIVEMRGYAQANGTAYQLLDIHTYHLLWVLFTIEFATLHSQDVMAGFTTGQYIATHVATVAEAGANRIVIASAQADAYAIGQSIGIGTTQGGNQIAYGREITDITVVDASNKALVFDGAPVDIALGNYVYNVGWRNGFSGWIEASSGSLVSNSSGKYPMVYRGIENLYGNVWQWIDGVNVDEGQAWICRDARDYISGWFASPYEQLSYVNGDTNGYVLAMGYDPLRPFAQFPVTVDAGISNSAFKDYYYRNTGQRSAFVGGSWHNGSNAGLSIWNLAYGPSDAYVSIGARLVRKAG